MERWGVFGGSFDPIHSVHVQLIRVALEQLRLRRVVVLPAYRSPHKGQPEVAADHRLRMVELALSELPHAAIDLDAREIESAAPVRTVDSLSTLAAEHPGVAWTLLLGQDSYEQLDRWADPGRLAGLCDLAVLPRPGGSPDRAERWRDAAVHWLHAVPSDLSSTAIREALRRGERPGELPDAIFEYIRSHSLYGIGNAGR